jgi:hypothetical protein
MARRRLLTGEHWAGLLALPTDERDVVRHCTLAPDDLAVLAAKRADHNRVTEPPNRTLEARAGAASTFLAGLDGTQLVRLPGADGYIWDRRAAAFDRTRSMRSDGGPSGAVVNLGPSRLARPHRGSRRLRRLRSQ